MFRISPYLSQWIPAFAGMTWKEACPRGVNWNDKRSEHAGDRLFGCDWRNRKICYSYKHGKLKF